MLLIPAISHEVLNIGIIVQILVKILGITMVHGTRFEYSAVFSTSVISKLFHIAMLRYLSYWKEFSQAVQKMLGLEDGKRWHKFR